ncbi:MAG: TonB-dependent receptor [Cohaesibacter sp.]|nr:TonB-dependent receptor [Cohaesibacter sp.]
MHTKIGFLSFLSASLLASVAVRAEDHKSDIMLEPIVISAGRLPVEAAKVGRSHSILSGETLEKHQTRYVADALREVPGLSVSRTGSFGGLTQIRMRGSEGNHVLVLIDGIEVSETSQGEYDFGSLQVADIERIEVLRGPQSALYGSNAMAGVIHIITKDGRREGREVTARTEYGSDNTMLASLAARGGGETFDLAVSGSFRKTDGFNISDFGTEKDGDRNVTLNGKFNWDLSDQVAFHASMRHVDRNSDTDNQDFRFPAQPTQGLVIDTASYTKTKEFYVGTGLDVALFDDQLLQTSRFEYSEVKREGMGSSKYGNSGERFHASHQASLSFDTPSFANAKHRVTTAFEWEHETYTNDFPFASSQIPTQTRDLFGYVAEYRGEFWESLFVGGALRFDQNDKFEDAVTYNADIAYLIDRTNTRFHASIGSGVTNPTFSEQFGYTPDRFIGNPNLKPEENFGWDIGIEQSFFDERAKIDVTYFNERLKNEIFTRYTPTFMSSPQNMDGTSKRQGIEIAANAQVSDALSVRGSYTYLLSEEATGLKEVRRPKHSASMGVNWSFWDGKANLFADAIYRGSVEDNEFVNATPRRRTTLDDYVLINAGGDYQLTDTVKAFARVENLLDTKYEEVFGFNTQGRAFFAGFEAKF